MTTQEVERPPVRGVRVREWASAAPRRSPRWYVELFIVAAFYVAYEASRAATPARPISALHHARGVIHLESVLHVGIERSVNDLLVHANWLAVGSGYYYATLNYLVTPAILIWLLVRRPQIYRSARTALVLASFGALIVYVLFPVAPPRLALPGTTDIVVVHNILDAGRAAKSGGFLNIYAAMPSLHVGWAVWVALAVDRANSGNRWRHLIWLYPVATTFVVIATANHYVLDAVAGAGAVLAAWWLVRGWQILSQRRSRLTRRCSKSEPCELCDFEGPRRYLITFISMLEANGMHIDPNHPALLGDDLDARVETIIPVLTAEAGEHALDDVLVAFTDWGADLARVSAHESAA